MATLFTTAARFFQLLSGHAMITPFLKERWGWTDTDICWWCNRGRQSREQHLFKECSSWKREIRELWNTVGELSGRREQTGGPLKSREGFGYRVRKARARPSNTSVRDLLSSEQYTGATSRLPENTRVGEAKEGAICK